MCSILLYQSCCIVEHARYVVVHVCYRVVKVFNVVVHDFYIVERVCYIVVQFKCLQHVVHVYIIIIML